MLLFRRVLLVAVVSLISGAAYAQSSSSSPTTSIKMLPPSDFSGNACSGTKIGMLQWDSVNPIRCVPGFIGDSNGNVGIGTTTPYNKLQIGSVGTSGYGGNSLAIGNGTSVFAITPFAGVTALYTNTNFAFVPSGSGATGNVGIGTTSPQVKLDVAGEARVGSSGGRCTSANEGAIRYDSVSKEFVGCDGSSWKAFVVANPDVDVVTARHAFSSAASYVDCRAGYTSIACTSVVVPSGAFSCMATPGYTNPSTGKSACAQAGCGNQLAGDTHYVTTNTCVKF